MSDENKKAIEDYIVLLRTRALHQLEQCRRLMHSNSGSLDDAINGYLDIMIDLDKIERELKSK